MTVFGFERGGLAQAARFERAVAEALTLFYYGVYVPNLGSRVLSPNSDGVDDAQSFSYKLVRPSTVSATLNGPGGAVVAARALDELLASPKVARDLDG